MVMREEKKNHEEERSEDNLINAEIFCGHYQKVAAAIASST